MKTIRLFAVLAAAIALNASAALAASTPMAQDDGGRFTIAVTIDGQGPLAFVVDSAAQRSVIGRAGADRLKLATEAGGHMEGASGTARADIATATNYTSALFARDSEPMGVLPHQGVSNADGVVGMNLFASQRLDFDFAGRTLSAGPSGASTAGLTRIPVTLTAGTFLIADVVIDGVHVKALIDTGARRTVGNPLLCQALGLKDGDPRLTPDEPIGGATMDQTPAVKAVVGDIALGPAHFAKPQVTFADLPVFRSLGIGGGPALILGIDQLKTLHELAIDYPRAELQIKT